MRDCLNIKDDQEIEEIFDQIDTNHNNFIEYSEFITATMDRSVQLSSQNLEMAFMSLANDQGVITME